MKISKLQIQLFNLERLKADNIFSREEMSLKLKSIGISEYAFSYLVKNGCLDKLGNNKYSFPKNPVYIGRLQQSIDDFSRVNNINAKKHYYSQKDQYQKMKIFVELCKNQLSEINKIL